MNIPRKTYTLKNVLRGNFMKNKIKFVVGIGLLSMFMFIFGWSKFQLYIDEHDDNSISNDENSIENTETEELKEVVSRGIKIVIDPGHGGKDPGKIAINGELEKDINLAISLLVERDLIEQGYEVIMTRTTDEGLHATGSEWGKVQDLQQRVQLINESEATLAISIHQNSYTEESIKGAQVFYYENSAKAKAAAALMQEQLKILDPDNHREIKGNDTYYLIKRTITPTIIVECGFLSNQNEAENLCDETYQKELAQTIVKGINEYVEFNK